MTPHVVSLGKWGTMSSKEKLFRKIKNNPKNVSYDELVSLLGKYGCIVFERKGSHAAVTHKDASRTLTVPRKKPIKQHYVKDCIKFIEEVNDL